MASIEKLPSGKYRAVYYLPERPGEKPRKRRVPGTFTHKRAAERAAIEAEGRAIADPQHDPARGRMTWAQWEQAWLPTLALTPKSKARTESVARVHVRPRWGSVPSPEIGHHDVQVWCNELAAAGTTPGTLKRIFYALSGSLTAALRADVGLRANPCRGVKLSASPSAPERYLTDDEVAAIFARLRGRYRVFAELLLATGMRLSEAVGLHWERVDLAARTIRVAGQWDDEDTEGGVPGRMTAYTKDKVARTVPMTDELVELLTEWSTTCPPGTTCGRVHRGPPCRSSLVVPAPRGGPIDAHNLHARQWSPAIRAAGVGHCRIHDLRHTWASRLVTGGASLERLQTWGGWESFSMVQRYGHFMTDDHDAFRAAMGRARAAPKLRAVE